MHVLSISGLSGMHVLSVMSGFAMHVVTWFLATEAYYPTWLIAFSFALLSGISLPVGAVLGVVVTPAPGSSDKSSEDRLQKELQRKDFVGACMAFGAGSLLFAVTVELYGKQLRRLDNHGYVHHVLGMIITTVAAVLGGVLYTYTNRWLCNYAESKSNVSTEATPLIDKPALALEAGTHGTTDKTAAGISIWLGVFIDGLPEGVLLGFLAAEHRLSMVLVISLFIANFPEAFSSACLLKEAGWKTWKILSMWTLCFVLTALLAMASCAMCPANLQVHIGLRALECFIEGLAGGAMLACVTAVMLPEAFAIHKDFIGLLCLFGFLTSVVLKVTAGVASELATKVHPLSEGYQEISVLLFRT
jgi:zinc transporter ZupT